MAYDHQQIEKKAQEKWQELNLYTADLSDTAKEPYYLLVEFPYPSGDLHIGHWYAFAVTDIYARMLRARGKNVLFPIGFDAFGLPAENAAIKNGVDPKEWTLKNIERMKTQLASMGASFDWGKEVVACDPGYYQWTQWIFAKLFEHNLAEHREAAVKWCPKDQTVLANEQVVDGCCERCGTPVEEKRLTQWFLKITQYAERLLAGLDNLPWREEIKEAQRAWIGKSEGAYLEFPIAQKDKPNFLVLHGYTGRADTNFIPWLKKELESKGYEVQAPQLPNTDTPTEPEQVDYVIENCRIDEQTIIVGHSLGGVVAVKVLQKINRPIAGLVLVAPAVEDEFRTGEPRPFWKTFSWDFDYAKIKSLSKFQTILSDSQEAGLRLPYLKHLAGKLDAPLVEGTAEEEHFCAKEEPLILENLHLSDFGLKDKIKVFTTRPDTVYGATYVVLAPEHPLVKTLVDTTTNKDEILRYIAVSQQKTERERSENKEKTGVKLEGISAINPATKEEIPVYVADYVLGSYGTGAVMAVPAHDQRDYEFAEMMQLPVRDVIEPVTGVPQENPESRESIVAVVVDRKNGTILTLDWGPELGGKLYIGGGREKGEDAAQAAMREVAEETGYTDVRLISRTSVIHHSYFAYSKNVAREIEAIGFLFELNSDKKNKQKLEKDEHGKFTVSWLPLDQAGREVTETLHKTVFDRLVLGKVYTGSGILVDSGEFSGKKSEEAKWDIVSAVGGENTTQYRIRDWLVSRQRYWGCPIPIVYDPEGKPHAVPAEHLPWLLPTDVDFKPTGKAPLASSAELKERVTKLFGEGWTPEYDTLDTFVDSSWYFLRYLDNKNTHDFSDAAMMKKWLPINRYSGGSEHTTMHLLYARFFMQALYDLALVPVAEPFAERFNRGLIMGPDGAKMSKSKGNVINPDEFVQKYGADAVRLYLAFIGPYNEPGSYPWGLEGVASMRKFLDRIERLAERVKDAGETSEAIQRALARASMKVAEDGDRFKFNTAVAALMILLNELEATPSIPKATLTSLAIMLAPFAPHLSEHLWEQLGGDGSVHQQPWPAFDANILVESSAEVVVQVGGRRRGSILISSSAEEAEAAAEALKIPAVAAALAGQEPKRIVYVAGKIINLVV